jgi:glyoxylase-like metal-dependent hydrolase (beta-lactamase superfamily II)
MRLALLMLLFPAVATAVEIAPGVHVLRHADATPDWPEGNTTVIIGKRGVLVVDAAYLPSTARADLAEIRKLTKLPVRYLVNTHWHYDHVHGNAVYRQAFPALDIVAHVEARRLIETQVPRYAGVASGAGSPQRKRLAELVGQDTPEKRALEKEQRELASVTPAPPTVTYTDELHIDLGGREVVLLHPGRGNTPGDTAIWLPADEILVAGDLLVLPVPYAFNSFPADWARTLRRLRALGPKVIVPGHGDVQRDLAYLDDVVALLETTTTQVRALSANNLTADEVRKRIDLAAAKQKFCAGDATREAVWDESITGALIERTWLWSRGGL